MVQIDQEIVRPGEAVLEEPSSRTWYQRYGKRGLDLAMGVALLLLTVPLVLVLAVLVALTSGWPPFYVATRIGRDGKPFRLLKLRTMVRGADRSLEQWRVTDPEFEQDYVTGFKVQADSRVTLVGRILRRTSFDELPQLWNVVKGDMSLVGPRPIIEDELLQYGPHADTLLSVRPGLTGPWQLNGRNRIGYPERVWVELRYCNSSTFFGDLILLARTVVVPFRLSGR